MARSGKTGSELIEEDIDFIGKHCGRLHFMGKWDAFSGGDVLDSDARDHTLGHGRLLFRRNETQFKR
jgi:hypothetical protein